MRFPRYNTRQIRCPRLILLINPNDMPLKSVSRSIVNLKRCSNLLMQTTTKRKSVFVRKKKWKKRSLYHRKNMGRKKDITDIGKRNIKRRRSLKFHKINFVQSTRMNPFSQQSRYLKDASLISYHREMVLGKL